MENNEQNDSSFDMSSLDNFSGNESQKTKNFYQGVDFNDCSISGINKNNNTTETNDKITTMKTSEYNRFNQLAQEKAYPYPPDATEIPEINIKDENNLYIKEKNETNFSALKIDKYFDKLNNFDDKKFTKCIHCNYNEINKFYCESCESHYCKDCTKDCKIKNHKLINLENMEEELIKDHRTSIKRIISKKIKANPVNDNNLSELNESVSTYVETRTNDIILIQSINLKNYINYFHFQNISSCLIYLVNKHVMTFKKNCLKIVYEDPKCNNNENNEIQKCDENQNNETQKLNDNQSKNIQIFNENQNNETKKSNNQNEYKIFGEEFVQKYKDKLALIINNDDIKELIDKKQIDDDYLEVILYQKEEKKMYIEDLSFMFKGCRHIKEFNKFIDRKLLDFSRVNTIDHMFSESQIKNIDLSIFGEFPNLTYIDDVFSGCKQLIEINGLQNWNTKKVKSMSNMFKNCSELKIINDISKFEIINTIKFTGMFCNCSSLEKLPDITKWNMSNAIHLEGMFKECRNLRRIPDISLWNVEKVTSMEEMFYKCSALKILPDISLWNVENVTSMKKMFSKCSALEILPDFSKWKLENIQNLSKMFYKCTSLKQSHRPDIRKWQIKNKKVKKSKIFDDEENINL